MPRTRDLDDDFALVAVVERPAGEPQLPALAPAHPDLVPLAGLPPSDLERVVLAHYAETGGAPLPGGFTLLAGGEVLIVPQCCGDLDDLWSWWQTLALDHAWQELWIGHPCLLARNEDGLICLSPGFEPGGTPCAPDAEATVFRLRHPPLAAALNRVEAELEYLAALLGRSLPPGGRNGRPRARQLLGLPER